jgi:hypothetical protein
MPPRVRRAEAALSESHVRLVDDVQPVGFANSGGVVFVDESAEEISSA